MSRDEIDRVLGSLFQKRSVPYDAPTERDWNDLKRKFGTSFSDEFCRFIELACQYRFRGEILNVARHGNVSSNDTIQITYDFEMQHGRWKKDMIPFYSIGNGDYFCHSATAGKGSPVFYVYHEDGSVESYSGSVENWIKALPRFFS
jgi:hypothetical protein